ncbi:phospholipase [Streptacidiphilus pinicola]|uniref:Phospholipase n=1 Tax=Streptacidiphilus pinicola TaxID=2219663 RepID=A0A2X0I8R8_9ACTN|nr:phospholipase [Streptacidiphilus pinicola]
MPAPSRQGSVVLDIGAGTGALVIHATRAQDALEIHVSPVGLPDQRTHAAVRPRHLPGRTLYAAVITPLPAGRYTVWNQDDTAHGTTTVTDGHVSDYAWA